nr:hypothetical protein Q903MT_gene5183 [Picea sitchensis]
MPLLIKAFRYNLHRLFATSVPPFHIRLQGKLVPLACIGLGRRLENEGTIKRLIFPGATYPPQIRIIL